jgi:SOS-response transcriptional repressor LexA
MAVNQKIAKVIPLTDTGQLGKRIKELRRRLKWGQAELAAHCGISQTIVSQWESGTRNIATEHLISISKAAPLEERAFWLEQAGVEVHQGGSTSVFIEALGSDFQMIPLLKDAVAAGTPRAIDEKEIERKLPMPRKWIPGGKIIAMRVKGDSMAPIILDGHIVLVDVSERDPKKLIEQMVAAREDNGVTIKWLRKDGPLFMLVPQHTSKRHPVRIMKPSDDFAIVGKVVMWLGMPPK